MSNLRNLNLFGILESTKIVPHEEAGKIRLSCNYEFPASDDFIPQAEALVAPYIVVDDFKQTYENLTSANLDYVKAAYAILVGYSRSSVLKSPLNKLPEYSSATPGIMAVAKRINNVPYTRWDLNAPRNRDYIGRMMPNVAASLLYGYYGKQKELLVPYTPEELYIFSSTVTVKGVNVSKSGNEEFDKLPSYLRMFLLRQWVWSKPGVKCLFYDLDDLEGPGIRFKSVLTKEVESSPSQGLSPWAR